MRGRRTTRLRAAGWGCGGAPLRTGIWGAWGARGGAIRMTLALAVIGGLGTVCGGQGPPPSAEPAPLFYRRIFVPQEALESQIRGLLPLLRTEFEQRLDQATRELFPEAASPLAAHLAEMRLSARFREPAVLEGTAELDVVWRGSQPAWLVLEPWGLPLVTAVWRSPTLHPAVLGRDPAGRLCCLVDRSGVLELSWHQAAREVRDEERLFELPLPPAPRREMTLRAPSAWSIAVRGGWAMSDAAPPGQPDETGWKLALGGGSAVQLVFNRPAATREHRIVWRESSRYTLHRGTFDVEMTWSWESLDGLPSGVQVFSLPAGLRVTAARLDEERVPLTSVPEPASGQRAVAVPLTSKSTAGTLVLTATGDWPTDGRFTLPRVVPRDGVYQEGQVELVAEAWLQVQPRAVRGCERWPSAAAASVGLRHPDRFAFQLWDPQAQIEVTASPSFAPLHVESATQLLVEPNQVLAATTAEVTVQAGQRFELQAQVPRPWIVDAVDVQPAEMLAERSLTARGGGPQLLRVQLVRPLLPGRPLRLTLRAHFRRPPPGQPLGEGVFQPLSFPEAASVQRWIAVRVEDTAAELRLEGDERFQRLEEKDLTLTQRQLFEQPPSGLLLATSDPTATARAILDPATARYEAELFLRVEAGRRQVQHTLSLRCSPEGAALGGVLVRLAPPPRESVTWHLADDPSRELTAIPEPAAAASTGHPAEVWRIPLPRPRTTPFEVTAHWTSPLAATHEVPLAGLPDATLTTALVEVHARDGHLAVQTRQMEPLPPAPPAPGRYSTLCGRFHYAAGQQPQLLLVRTAAASEPRAWIESLTLTSRWTPEGRGEHEAHLRVRNAGREELRITLPPQIDEAFWSVAPPDPAEPHALPLAAPATSGETVIPLPPLQAQAEVTLRYRTQQRGLGRWPLRTWQVPLPSIDLPVLQRRWQIVLPSDLSVWSSRMPDDASAAATWPASVPPGRTGPAPTPEQDASTAHAAPSLPGLGDRLWAALAGPGWLAEACRSLVSLPPRMPDSAMLGWQQWSVPLPDGPQAEVTVYRISWAAAWALGLAGMAAAWGWRRRGSLAATAAVALLCLAVASGSDLPPRWWWLGIGLGALAGGGLALAWPGGMASPHAPPPFEGLESTASRERSRRVPLVRGLGGWWMRLLLGCTGGLVVARLLGLGGAEAVRAEGRPPPWKLVVPVDAEGHPTGDYVYLEPGFYEALHQRSTQKPPAQPPWLVARARYELGGAAAGPVAAGPEQPPTIERLRVLLDLYTFEPAVRVVLPWRPEEVMLHPGQSRLDGQSVALAWEPAGQGLELVVKRPGKHQLELVFATQAKRAAEKLVLELTAPPAAVEEWTDAPPEVREESGIRSAGRQPSRPQFFRVRADRLRWEWPEEPTRSTAVPVVAEQLLWWKIRRGSVSLEAHFRVQGLLPGPCLLPVEVDPRLRQVGGLSQGPIRRITSDPQRPHRLLVECEAPAAGDLAWQMTWLWPQASGCGQLPLPTVRLGEARLRRDWTAFTLDPSLEWLRPPPAQATAASGEVIPRGLLAAPSVPDETPVASDPPTPADFLRAWGEADAPPQYVLASSAPELRQPLVVCPRLPAPTAALQWDWSLGESSAKLRLRAALQGAAGRFEHQLLLPAAFRVRRVAWTQGGRLVPLRWSQQNGGSVRVTLLEPPAAEAVFEMEGWMPLPSSRDRWTLPAGPWEGVRVAADQVRLYRQREVLVQGQAGPGWREATVGPPGSFHPELGWLVAAWERVEERAGPLLVQRRPHQPQLAGHLFLRVRQEADGWLAEAVADLEVRDGFLDELRLSVPAAWSGQLGLEPSWESRVEPSAVASRRLWTIRPPSSLAGKVQLTLRGRLDPAGGGIGVPDVSLPTAPQVARWVLLETGTPQEPILWEPRGLVAVRPQDLPPTAPPWSTERGQWFRVVARRFEAVAQLRQLPGGPPQCWLAEYTVTCRPDQRVRTQATFTLAPADARPLSLHLPPGQRLVHVLVNGVGTAAQPLGPRAYRVAAPSVLLPYQLTVLTEGGLPGTSQPLTRLEWPLPQLAELPLTSCLITVRGLPSHERLPGGWLPATDQAQLCSADEATVQRLQTLLRCLEESAAAQGRDLPGGIVAEAVHRWLTAIEQTLARMPHAGTLLEPALQTRLESARQTAQVLQARNQWPRQGDETPPQSEATETRMVLDETEADTPALYLRSEQPLLDLLAAWPASPPWKRFLPGDEQGLLAALLGAAAAAAGLVGCFPRATAWLAGHVPLMVMLGGVLWWLLAPWGGLGWLLVLAGMWQSGRRMALRIRREPLSAGPGGTGRSRRLPA